MDYTQFRINVLNANKKHKFKVTNSYGTKAAWRWIKKNKWLNIGQPITELQLGTIIKTINQTLQDQLIKGKDVLLPCRMGRLEIRRYEAKLECKDGKISTTLPIDWKRTLNLWWEDEEAYLTKKLIRHEDRKIFTIYFNKKAANFVNKSFYEFLPTRAFKKRLKEAINNNRLDALLLKKYNEVYKHTSNNG